MGVASLTFLTSCSCGSHHLLNSSFLVIPEPEEKEKEEGPELEGDRGAGGGEYELCCRCTIWSRVLLDPLFSAVFCKGQRHLRTLSLAYAWLSV